MKEYDQEEYSHSTGAQFISGWQTFLTKMKELRPNSKGQYILKKLQYNQHSIDKQNRTSFMRRLFMSNEDGCRYYLLYIPENPKPMMPLIILLHGTGGDMLTTQLIFIKKNQTLWMNLADKEGIVIAVPQARIVIYRKTRNIVWQPGDQDLIYIKDVINNVLSIKGASDIPIANKNNINFVGKSNGGLFISDMHLIYTVKQNQSKLENLGFRINLFCNYMGGMEKEQLQGELIDLDEEKKKTRVLIMTCPGQDNYIPCLRAHQFLTQFQCNVKLIKVNHDRHEFLPESVQQIYQQIKQAYEISKKQF